MPEIPKVVCGNCKMSMGVEKNAITLQALNQGKPYYKINADKWRCAKCKHEIYLGFAKIPVAMKHDIDYNSIVADVDFELSDNAWYDA